MTFRAQILTLYPEMFPGPLGISLAGRALEEGTWSCAPIQIRDFATDKHRTVDDTPAGGGAGMVLRADILSAAVAFAKREMAQKMKPRPFRRGGTSPPDWSERLHGVGVGHIGLRNADRPHPLPPPLKRRGDLGNCGKICVISEIACTYRRCSQTCRVIPKIDIHRNFVNLF